MTTINPGDKGIDFLVGFPPAANLRVLGIRFVAFYLKKWSTDYTDELHDAGIGVLPIWETTATMMTGGAVVAAAHATKAVADTRRYGIPEGTTLIFAHDTSTMTPAVVEYSVEAERVVRSLRYGYGGYGGRRYFDLCMGAGVRFDVIWATNATAWLGGRHPQAHIWQGHYTVDGSDKGGYDVVGGVNVDKDVCQRTFQAWGPDPPRPPPPLEEDDMPRFVGSITNDHPTGPGAIWELVAGCKLHIGEGYFNAWAPAPGTPATVVKLSNAELDSIPDYVVAAGAVKAPQYIGALNSIPGEFHLTPVNGVG